MLRKFGQIVQDVTIKSGSLESGRLVFSASPWHGVTLPSTLVLERTATRASWGLGVVKQPFAKHHIQCPGQHVSSAWPLAAGLRRFSSFQFRGTGPHGSRGWPLNAKGRSFSTIPPDNVVYGIMMVNFATFFAWQQDSYRIRHFMARHFMTSYSHLRTGYIHTLVTHAISHQQAMHLFSNMFTFYFFGSSLGGVIGSARLVQLYVASAVSGGLAQSLFDKRSPGLGASAAVNSIVIFSVLLNPTATYLLYGILPLPAWALGLGWLAYDGMGAYKGSGNVAYMAHLGGAAVGVAAFAALTSGLW